MSPIVLSCNVPTVDDFHWGYSLSLSESEPPLPPPRPLSIVSRRAFGVYPSDEADEVVKALHFETHLVDAPGLSHLTVRGKGASFMDMIAVDDNLVVLASCFQPYQSPVYLVYDAVDQSITMIPSHPWLLPQHHLQPGEKHDTVDATRVLIARPPAPAGDDRSYALVNMAETRIYTGYNYEPDEKQDVLYVWRSSSLSPKWDLIRAKFPSKFKGDNVAHSYVNVLAFTCGDHAFWANLPHGLMYCRVDALLSPSTTGELKFGFIQLPVDHPPCPIQRAVELDSEMYQTVGRSGDSSIKFVTIDGFVQLLNFRSCTLKVWTLSPDKGMTRWTKRFLCLDSLADQDEFKKNGLPTDMVPMYPNLSAEEDDVVYFMLGKYTKCCQAHKRSKIRCKGYIPAAKNPLYHLRVDMRRGVLLASARLPESTSPSLSIASTSVVPSSMIQRGSMGRKGKRHCGDGNRKGGRRPFSQ
jgi:hypothetical protein